MAKSFNGVLSKKNVSLKKFNTFRVNAKALEFYIPETIDGFIDLIKYLNDNNKRYMILGGGSNILFLDKVIEFPIIYTGFFSRIEHTSHNILAYSGAKVFDVVKYAYKNAFTGLEFLYGLPGTIGGATYMNARCYEHSVSEFIDSVGIIDDNIEYMHIGIDDCKYAYKKSVFQDKNYIIVDVRFKLNKGSKKLIKPEMKKFYKDRKNKNQFKYPSAGSTFLNDYETNMIAGKVIDSINMRNVRVGGAMVSPYHANFIINYNNATGRDILNLMRKVREEVYNHKGITLNAEVKIISNDENEKF
ncbi:UDP-N-acetylenolpyruvoylglucosamine reductase [Brachyspira hampsonii]|uniref:UDP-N-acetylenolpyruvoylglucosamine reductase n=2 Tax=Brachyspira hampsonii TaxID=1287055 RepID=A0AAC9TTS3_9SPIR|nr:UDP-N-acetylmuramate dehydrogenase [Brachyspira hampsonii]ASJ20597.1 UDP-N-acetylenolpyruvoylglucosamine reductase [Brachyspira hampsonii]OEJ18377.1 UDP-N-acetylenolpyruvoylglucosamine reductase [Brachyspira hampsonii]